MKAVGKFVVVENLEKDDVQRSNGGIYIANGSKPNIGHYKVVSVGSNVDTDVLAGDTIWALAATVSTSKNLDTSLGIVKYDNIMAKD